MVGCQFRHSVFDALYEHFEGGFHSAVSKCSPLAYKLCLHSFWHLVWLQTSRWGTFQMGRCAQQSHRWGNNICWFPTWPDVSSCSTCKWQKCLLTGCTWKQRTKRLLGSCQPLPVNSNVFTVSEHCEINWALIIELNVDMSVMLYKCASRIRNL